jgi:hypothetical protein
MIVSILSLLLVFGGGCNHSQSCRVVTFGPEYMTYRGDPTAFDDVCRTVLHELSDKEIIDENRVRYPHYAEGVSAHKAKNGEMLAARSYRQTKDAQGYEYIITSIHLTGNDPLVILETTNPDQFKLSNALCQEFHKMEFKVVTK